MEKDSLVAILGHLNDIPHVLSGTAIQTCTVCALISIPKPFIIPYTLISILYCNCFTLLSKIVDPKQPCILKFFKKSTSTSMTNKTVAEQSASSEGMIEGDPYIMWILLQLKIQQIRVWKVCTRIHIKILAQIALISVMIVGRKLMKLVI